MAISGPTLCGTSQHSRRAPSSRARPSADGGRDPHALAVEVGSRAKPDEHPALAARVPDREVAVLGFRLARIDEPLKDAVHVVRDALAFEDPEHHRVRIGVRRKRGG